jgi:hypothetical protein
MLPVYIWGKVDLPDPDPEWLSKSEVNRGVWYWAVETLCSKSRDAVRDALAGTEIIVDAEVEGSPVIHALAWASDLRKVSHSEPIASILLDEGPGIPTSVDWLYAVEGSLPHVWGIDGNGEKIALQLVEKPPASDYTTKVVIQATANPNGITSTAATWAMGFIRSRPGVIPGLPDPDQGIAPASLDYMADSYDYQGLVEIWAYNQGARTLVYAMGSSYADQGTQTNHDKFVDYYARTYRRLVVASAGNRNTAQGSCSQTYSYVQNKFFNGLIVGGTNTSGTRSRLDDALYACSSYTNPLNSTMEIPHVVAPARAGAEGLDAGGYIGVGTSASAAIVGSIATLVHDKNNALRGMPEAVRAIVMATAWRNVDGGRLVLTDAVDDRDGVGEVSAARAVKLADPANKKDGGNAPAQKGFDYGTMHFPDDFSLGRVRWYTERYSIYLPAFSALQAVLAWSATSTCSDYTQPGDCGSVSIDNNLDLYLDDGSNPVASSVSTGNAYEYIYYYNGSNSAKNLTLKVAWDGIYKTTTAFFGIAWDTLVPTNCPDTELCGPSKSYVEFSRAAQGAATQTPAVTRLGTGEWVIVWPTKEGCPQDEGPKYRVLAQLADYDGKPVGTPMEVAGCSSYQYSYQVQVAPIRDDMFVVAWHHGEGAAVNRDYDVRARVFLGYKGPSPTPFGVWSQEFTVAGGEGWQLGPGLAAKDDQFWVVWRDSYTRQIHGKRCYPVNPSWTPGQCTNPIRIDTTGTGDSFSYDDTTGAATLSNGRFVVVWRKRVGEQHQLRGRVFNWDGSPVTSEFAVSPLSSSVFLYPHVASLGTSFVVGYVQDGIKAIVMDSTGNEVCHVNNANSGTYGQLVSNYWLPKVAGDGSVFAIVFPLEVFQDNKGEFWRKYSTSAQQGGECIPEGLEERIDTNHDDADSNPVIWLSSCCTTTAIVAWPSDCTDPVANACLNHRVLAW